MPHQPVDISALHKNCGERRCCSYCCRDDRNYAAQCNPCCNHAVFKARGWLCLPQAVEINWPEAPPAPLLLQLMDLGASPNEKGEGRNPEVM